MCPRGGGGVRRGLGDARPPLQTIRAVQPDVVVVELCQYRVSMLKMDERTLLREAREVSLEKLQQAVRQVRPRARSARGARKQGRRTVSGGRGGLGAVRPTHSPGSARPPCLPHAGRAQCPDRRPRRGCVTGAGLGCRGERGRGRPQGRGQAAGPRLRSPEVHSPGRALPRARKGPGRLPCCSGPARPSVRPLSPAPCPRRTGSCLDSCRCCC